MLSHDLDLMEGYQFIKFCSCFFNCQSEIYTGKHKNGGTIVLTASNNPRRLNLLGIRPPPIAGRRPATPSALPLR